MSLNERDIKVAIVAAIGAMVVSVVLLDMKGYIKHSKVEDSGVIAEFKLMAMGSDNMARLSSKTANKEAFCADGYLLMRPQKSETTNVVAGLLVDSKNRAVVCSTSLPAPRG
ncbi:MAG: hypothetical protein RPR40_03615 [Bermanella sp.]